MNEHVHPVFAAILGSTVPELLEDAGRREKSRRRRERLERESVHRFAAELEFHCDARIDVGVLSKLLADHEERMRRLGL